VVLLTVPSPLLSEYRVWDLPSLSEEAEVLFRSLDTSVSTVTRLRVGASGILRTEGSYCLSSSPVPSCFDCILLAHSKVYTASTQFSVHCQYTIQCILPVHISVYCQHTIRCILPSHNSVYTASTQLSVHCQYTIQCILPAHNSMFTASTQFSVYCQHTIQCTLTLSAPNVTDISIVTS
jgi:hypothetical protein